METTHFDTPEDAAIGLKFSLLDFSDEWLEKHNVHDENQRDILDMCLYLRGWEFFHEELLDYFRKCPDRYTVHDDDSIECSM